MSYFQLFILYINHLINNYYFTIAIILSALSIAHLGYRTNPTRVESSDILIFFFYLFVSWCWPVSLGVCIMLSLTVLPFVLLFKLGRFVYRTFNR